MSGDLEAPNEEAKVPLPPSFLQALRYWFRLGCISFGGPAGQIALMHTELVERRRWISEKRFSHALSYCMVLPGPEAQQLATYLGWLLHGTWGGIVSGLLFVLPSLVLLVLLSFLYVRFQGLEWMATVLSFIKPVVAAIVIHAVYRMALRSLRDVWTYGIAVVAFAAMIFGNVAFPWLVIAAALLGWLVLGQGNSGAAGQSAHGSERSQTQANNKGFVIDDNTPIPQHAQPNRLRLSLIVLVGFVFAIVPMLALIATFGIDSLFVEMGWFFTKAALVTFGGAYAVLPYVHQAAVLDYQWLSVGQMLDALALGESTPGPLIMIVAFVGFVGAYQLAPLGMDAVLGAGVLAAGIATYFTFLPSFVFILLGAPLIEATRSSLHVQGPLAGISAAVVGAMLSLAWVLVSHVFWPKGITEALDITALVILLVAAAALFYFKRSVVEVVGAAVGLGALVGLLGLHR